MIWYDKIWYDMIWYDMIWYDMIWYDMIWYDMNDVRLLNNSKVGDYVDLTCHIKLEIKDTTDTARSASYIDVLGN